MMKKSTEPKLVTFIVLAATIVWGSIGLADNPIVQTVYTADPAPMVHGGVCYVYTSHDEDALVRNFFTMNNWRCYSTTDMVNWTDLGSPLSYRDFSWARGDAWAGQCVYRNGKFYYYVPMNRKNAGMAVGVAVSDRPEGPFTDPIGKPLVCSGHGDIDPTVFIDDDGQAYLYWGNPNLYYVKLNEDMISYSGQINKVPLTTESFGVRTKDDRSTQYEEGPWLYKRSGLYYLIFAAGPISEHISYSTSPSPTGPWTFGGTVMPTQGRAFTNHPGVCDYKGNSYFFYHNGALPGGGGFNRSVCVEQFEFNGDGSIPTINMTKAGAPQIGHLNPYGTVQAETICWESGVETQKCSEGGMNVCDIDDADFIKIKGVGFGAGAASFEARVASETNGGNIEIHLDRPTGTLAGTCAVPGTGGWQTWVTKSCTVEGATGVHDLYLVFTGGSGSLMNVNWWRFK
jgi:arabinoxylan arabinofuranohydrolase